jgi:hypothetical protein
VHFTSGYARAHVRIVCAATAVLALVGCVSWPVAVNDGLSASIPDHGVHELRLGVHTIWPASKTDPDIYNSDVLYPSLGYRFGLAAGPLAFELGAMGIYDIQEMTIGFMGSGHTISQWALGPVVAVGLRKPAITLRGMLGAVALDVTRSDGPPVTLDWHAYWKYWPQGTLLFGHGDPHRGLSGSLGARASRTAVGPVLLGQYAAVRGCVRPEVSLQFRAPWADATVPNQTTLNVGLTCGIDFPARAGGR